MRRRKEFVSHGMVSGLHLLLFVTDTMPLSVSYPQLRNDEEGHLRDGGHEMHGFYLPDQKAGLVSTKSMYTTYIKFYLHAQPLLGTLFI